MGYFNNILNQFPFGAFVYIFAGITCLVYSFHYRRMWINTKNEYSKIFWRLGIWVAIGLLLDGFPALIYPEAHSLKAILWFASTVSILIGITELVEVALISWGKKKLAQWTSFLVLTFAILLVAANFTNLSSPYTDNYGLIHWNINYPFNYIWFISGILITLIPAIFLFGIKTTDKKTTIKKTLFSATFLLGGLGGWSNIIAENTILLGISFIVMFLGFLALAIMAALERVIKNGANEISSKHALSG